MRGVPSTTISTAIGVGSGQKPSSAQSTKSQSNTGNRAGYGHKKFCFGTRWFIVHFRHAAEDEERYAPHGQTETSGNERVAELMEQDGKEIKYAPVTPIHQ